MTALPICARDPRYRVAIAELPLAATFADRAAGAIVVISPSAAAGDEARQAERDGAAALVLDPRAVPADDLAALQRELDVPVIVPRARVRTDVAAAVEGAADAARAVVAEAIATSRDRVDIVRDALAWSRLLAGGGLSLVAHEVTPTGALALLERDGLPVSFLFSLARTGTPVIRAHTIGHERAEVTIDDGARAQRVERHDADGVRTAPARFESDARLALRRAITALQTSAQPTDLADYAGDAALADRIAGA